MLGGLLPRSIPSLLVMTKRPRGQRQTSWAFPLLPWSVPLIVVWILVLVGPLSGVVGMRATSAETSALVLAPAAPNDWTATVPGGHDARSMASTTTPHLQTDRWSGKSKCHYRRYCGLFGTCDKATNTCICKMGHYGKTCRLNACTNFQCHRGTCSVTKTGTPQCTCRKNYKGPNCSERVTCPPSNCIHGSFSTEAGEENQCKCVCRDGYSGDACTIAPPSKKDCTVSCGQVRQCQQQHFLYRYIGIGRIGIDTDIDL